MSDLVCHNCGGELRKGEQCITLNGELAHAWPFQCVRRLAERVQALESRANYVRHTEPIALGGRHYEIKSGGPNEDE